MRPATAEVVLLCAIAGAVTMATATQIADLANKEARMGPAEQHATLPRKPPDWKKTAGR